MEKKAYEAPAVRKVRLVVTHAILADCHNSPNLEPKGELGSCTVTVGCYYGP